MRSSNVDTDGFSWFTRRKRLHGRRLGSGASMVLSAKATSPEFIFLVRCPGWLEVRRQRSSTDSQVTSGDSRVNHTDKRSTE